MKETFESNLSAAQKKEAESQKAYEHLKAAKDEEMPRSAPREATGVATRVRLAQQHGTIQSGSHSATISACEKRQMWQLAVGLLSRMAEAKWKRTPFARARQ